MSWTRSIGIYARNPQGGVESIPEYQQAGFQWYAFNVGDFTEGDWQVVIDRCLALGMPLIPWAYVRSDQDVRNLCDIGRRFDNRVLVNAERELAEGKVTVAGIAEATKGMDVALSGEAWAPNDIDYTLIRHIPVHLQLFPQENDTSRHPRDCRAHYYSDKGVRRVEWMIGLHGIDPTYFPRLAGAYGLYTVDDMEGRYSVWSSRPVAQLSATEYPYFGPGYGPSTSKPQSKPSKAWKSLKITMHNAGFANFGNPDEAYNANLVRAMQRFQEWAGISPVTGNYGKGSYEAIRYLWDANSVLFGPTTYAADDIARNLMRLAAAGK